MHYFLVLALLLSSVAFGQVCRDFLYWGYQPFISRLTGLPLDSANWDIRDGQDRNLYSYDENLNLYRDERITGTLHEITDYNVEGDSTWWWSENLAEEFRNPQVLEDSVLNFVVYTENRIKMQLFDRWDPDLTEYEIFYSPDSVYVFSTHFSNYSHQQETREIVYIFRNSQAILKTIMDTTSVLTCQDSPHTCLCISNQSDTTTIKRSFHTEIVADTLFYGSQALQSWYFPNDERLENLPAIPEALFFGKQRHPQRPAMFFDPLGRRQWESRRNYPVIEAP